MKRLISYHGVQSFDEQCLWEQACDKQYKWEEEWDKYWLWKHDFATSTGYWN